MRYIPAVELERVVLERLKELNVDDNTIKQIVEKANCLSEEEMQQLGSQVIGLENQVKPVLSADLLDSFVVRHEVPSC